MIIQKKFRIISVETHIHGFIQSPIFYAIAITVHRRIYSFSSFCTFSERCPPDREPILMGDAHLRGFGVLIHTRRFIPSLS
jgi:hypothetical protein